MVYFLVWMKLLLQVVIFMVIEVVCAPPKILLMPSVWKMALILILLPLLILRCIYKEKVDFMPRYSIMVRHGKGELFKPG